jgi:hypothetical protein
MNSVEAARMLGVAESEVVDVRAQAGWWHALHHDMASHEESWRRVPDAPADEQPEPDEGVEGSPSSGSGDEVPDGTVAEVLEWVGDDSDRAVAALEAEEAADQPRTTLVAALEKVVG